LDLVRLYGGFLPVDVIVDGERVTGDGPPWLAAYPTSADRQQALGEYAERVFDLVPFATIDLSVPEAGLTGVAFVLPQQANPAARAGHRVYLKRMLLAEGAEGVLPEWGVFARC